MTDHYITFNNESRSYSNKNLINVMSRVKDNDELIINLSTDDTMRLRNVTETLDRNGFEYLTKGSDTGTEYHIVAHPRKDK